MNKPEMHTVTCKCGRHTWLEPVVEPTEEELEAYVSCDVLTAISMMRARIGCGHVDARTSLVNALRKRMKI
jgi:hypothetical protein